MVGCHASVCYRKKCYKKKSVPVQTKNCWIILSHCIPFFGKFMPYPVFQDSFEMTARTPMKISTKIKEKNSGLIAGAPKKIHRQKQNISEKNMKKIT